MTGMTTNHRIMVVCEDQEILDRLGRHLCEQRYDVRCATSSAEALTCYTDWQAELVVVDYRLSNMPGLDLIEQIRTINPKARFILITPPGETPEFMRATRSRIVAYLGKPFDPDDLMHFVRGAFNLGESVVNRREHSRYPFSIDTHCVLINPFDNSESRPIASLMRDISRSGASLIVRRLFPVPAMLKVTFHLAHEQRSVTMLAKSISCTLTQIPNVFRLGVKFIGLLPVDMERMIAELSQHVERGAHTDIYMGKSFRAAIHEWLARHPGAVDEVEGIPKNIEELAEELSKPPDDKPLNGKQEWRENLN